MTFHKESEFTTPRPDCPNPELWHAADPDSSEFEVLDCVAGFIRALQPEVVLETGSAFGYGSQKIGQALWANGHGHLYSLEINPERAKEARGRAEGLPITIVECDSLTFDPPGPIGFAFFDSLPELRPREFKRYFAHFVKGAIVAFHDTGPQHQVRGLVEQLEREALLKAIFLRTPRGIAFAQVLN